MSNFRAYLFGSVARGEQDCMSDTDVLMVYDKVPNSQLQTDARAQVSSVMSTPCTFAEYSCSHLERLFMEGHLFAWHLHLEARPIPGWENRPNYLQPFPRPNPYTSGLVDAKKFSDLLRSAYKSIQLGSKSPVYEAGIAYVALRNIGMSLSSSILGRPCFSRFAPFDVSAKLRLPSPCTDNFYKTLIAARHASQRGLPAPPIAIEKLVEGINSACTWTLNIIEVARENPFS